LNEVVEQKKQEILNLQNQQRVAHIEKYNKNQAINDKNQQIQTL
jgi:hypothetical protein